MPPDIPQPARPLRFLIADDNAINQLVLGDQLEKLGHTVVAVTNGRDVLAALKDSAWDALMLDCHMPVMDGFETVAAIRRDEAASARRTWVVAVTASMIEEDRDACLRAGMDDFLTKPIRGPQLAEVIARIPTPEEKTPAVDATLLEGLAKAKSSNGENLLERMVKLFTESGPELLGRMDAAIGENDFPTAIGAVHKLAGGCGYFGADGLYALCMEFERVGRLNDHGALRSLAPRIRQEYERVERALRRA